MLSAPAAAEKSAIRTAGSGCIVSPPTRVGRPLPDRHLPENRLMRGKRMVLDDRECRAEREILRWGKVLTVP
jgi:hypothetical protein